MNLFVAGLPFNVNDQELKEIFEEYGEVSSAKVILDRETGKSRGFGFVDMPGKEDSEKALKALDGADLEGRTLAVKVAEDRKSGGGGGGGYRGGGGSGGGGGYRGGSGGGGGNRDRNRY